MDKATRELRDKLRAEHGSDVIFADVPRLGLIAAKKPSTSVFMDYLSSVWSPLESSGVAREQLVIDCLVHPKEQNAVAKTKRFLKAMPVLAMDISHGIEALSAGEYEEYTPDTATTEELDKKYEFGWGGIVPRGLSPIVLHSSETAGSLARGVIDAQQSGSLKSASVVRSAIMSFVEPGEVEVIEALLDERAGLMVPLWYRCQALAGMGVAELGKG